MDDVTTFFLGFAFFGLVFGIAGKLWTDKQVFERTNSAGIEGFDSFMSVVFIGGGQRLLAWLSRALIGLGIISLTIGTISYNL